MSEPERAAIAASPPPRGQPTNVPTPGAASDTRPDDRHRRAEAGTLEPLGPHGEGWVGIQTALALILLFAACYDPLAWGEPARSATLVAGAVIALLGVALFAWGAMGLGASFSIWVTPRPDAHLVTSGPYRWTRNPLCTAQAVVGLGSSLMWGSPLGLALTVVYAIYLDRGKLRREEETLLAKYPEYAEYMQTVTHRMWPVPPRRANAARLSGAARR